MGKNRLSFQANDGKLKTIKITIGQFINSFY